MIDYNVLIFGINCLIICAPDHSRASSGLLFPKRNKCFGMYTLTLAITPTQYVPR